MSYNSKYGIKIGGLNYYVFNRKTGRVIKKFTHVDEAQRFMFNLIKNDHPESG